MDAMLPMNALSKVQQITRNPEEYAVLMALGSLPSGGEAIELSVYGLEHDKPIITLLRPRRLPNGPVHGIHPDELFDAPTLQEGWPQLLGGLDPRGKARPRKFLLWDQPGTLHLLRASLEGRDPAETLNLRDLTDVASLLRDAHGEGQDPGTGLGVEGVSLKALLDREGLSGDSRYAAVGVGGTIRSVSDLLITTGARLAANLSAAPEFGFYILQCAEFLQKSVGGDITPEDGYVLLKGPGAMALDKQAVLWRRALSHNVFISFIRRAAYPDALRISAYPLIYGERGLGLGETPLGIEACLDKKRRGYLTFHFATTGSEPRPALPGDIPHSWGSIGREYTGDHLVGPWGEVDAPSSALSPHAQHPRLFLPPGDGKGASSSRLPPAPAGSRR